MEAVPREKEGDGEHLSEDSTESVESPWNFEREKVCVCASSVQYDTRYSRGNYPRCILGVISLFIALLFVAEETSWKFRCGETRHTALSAERRGESRRQKGEREREGVSKRNGGMRERSERCNGAQRAGSTGGYYGGTTRGPDRIPTRRVMRTYQHRSVCYLLSNGYPQPRTNRAARPPRSTRGSPKFILHASCSALKKFPPFSFSLSLPLFRDISLRSS